VDDELQVMQKLSQPTYAETSDLLTLPGTDSIVVKIAETGNDRRRTCDSVPERTTTVKV
jgi:hypothetical protein